MVRSDAALRLWAKGHRGRCGEKAVSYLRQAGLGATERGTNLEAVAHLEQALVACPVSARATAELSIDIHIDVRNALYPSGDWARMAGHLQEAEVLARSLGNQHRLGRIATFMMVQWRVAGDFDAALKFRQEALRRWRLRCAPPRARARP
jgi:hypothetical protein